jgi:hypothetical protein
LPSQIAANFLEKVSPLRAFGAPVEKMGFDLCDRDLGPGLASLVYAGQDGSESLAGSPLRVKVAQVVETRSATSRACGF